MQLRLSRFFWGLIFSFSTLALGKSQQAYEVWVVDQADTKPGYGGKIHIYPDEFFQSAGTKYPASEEIIDLGLETSELCLQQTGLVPVRPHMINMTSNQAHAVLAFVASGHVVIFDARTRRPLQCFISSIGSTGARQAHTAVPSPNRRWILVANQNGKMLERIDADFATDKFVWNHKAGIDLSSCQTPDGSPCESPLLRPDNAPICIAFDRSSSLAVITLRGGGLLVVDPRNTPMTIVQAFDSTEVKGNGCGGIQARDALYVNSGGGTAANLFTFDVYRLPLGPYLWGKQMFPSEIESVLNLHDHDHGADAHGMTVVGDEDYLWVIDRHRDLIEVLDLDNHQHFHTISLAGPWSSKLTPDLIELEPNGRLAFISLRGSSPLSGDPHVSTGLSPGLLVVEVIANGQDGKVMMLQEIHNYSQSQINLADPHGLAIRAR